MLSLPERFLAIAAPHNCLVCSTEGALVCVWCQEVAFPSLPSRCYRCKKLTKSFGTCKTCGSSSRLRRVWVTTLYKDVAKRLVWRYKFERARAAHSVIAQQMDQSVPFLRPHTIVTFVPTATSRLRLRGYDQAELIAREFARLRKLHCKRLVTRTTQARQMGSSKKQREQQLAGAFIVINPQLCVDASIVVLDDVLTTGSTLEAVATVLRGAGAKHVDGAVFTQQV